jgi:hypothetical protein
MMTYNLRKSNVDRPRRTCGLSGGQAIIAEWEAFFPATLGEFVKVYENGERCCGIAAGLRRQH